MAQVIDFDTYRFTGKVRTVYPDDDHGACNQGCGDERYEYDDLSYMDDDDGFSPGMDPW